ncbi:uncharacterized protein F4807DRAFT_463202 [Annulohypoxylon truncatum]|uniref:uncharacterized protein n=1 Tax=Annulohypoxylon truncatum TaxID=327061 RepID=UPI002007CBAD|nr:uncharacterized protein F4807DRAFT_463202 [Annulohypoxylon truncatum]KAI1206798.1 hypothetical protein F4807DRAFT_463202 [Annulohypoxylon truncatum]
MTFGRSFFEHEHSLTDINRGWNSISRALEPPLVTGVVVKVDSTSDDAREVVAYLGLGKHVSFGHLFATLAPLRLAQAILPLLANAPARLRFVLLGSMQGSTGGMRKYPLPLAIYGASKAAAHFLVRKLHFEHAEEGICIFASV